MIRRWMSHYGKISITSDPRGTSGEQKQCATATRTLAIQIQETNYHNGVAINLCEQTSNRKTHQIIGQIRPFNECKHQKTFISKFATAIEQQDALEVLLCQEQHKLFSSENKILEKVHKEATEVK